ncbi:BTAD domain-containing putative transcriptional regulator [Streptomyces sp. NPDC016309]|uniref:BTAD domain-containing putative transcriptional regulator n=1 Tax=Streptomyces sp. NPDC016309 TaxID=3364965 RepID=UPI0036F575C1
MIRSSHGSSCRPHPTTRQINRLVRRSGAGGWDNGGLWRGPALADVRGAPFAEREAERLARARLAALEDRIEADLVRTATGPGLVRTAAGPGPVAELQALTSDHPPHERLHALLIRALAAAGRNAEALAVFADLRERLADTFGSDPGPEVAAAHLAVLRGRPVTAEAGDGTTATGAGVTPVPARPAAGDGGNLDVPSTSFAGRTDDVRRVTELLGRARLVTLVGPGGAGKTRLARVCGC